MSVGAVTRKLREQRRPPRANALLMFWPMFRIFCILFCGDSLTCHKGLCHLIPPFRRGELCGPLNCLGIPGSQGLVELGPPIPELNATFSLSFRLSLVSVCESASNPDDGMETFFFLREQ